MSYKPTIEHLALLAEHIASGSRKKEIQVAMGLSYKTFIKYYGDSLNDYSFKKMKVITKPPYIKGSKVGLRVDTSRDEDIVNRYKSGQTLAQIGEVYGVCRERIRQILSRYNMDRNSGGQHARAVHNSITSREKQKARKQTRCIQVFGCTLEQLVEINGNDEFIGKNSIAAAYRNQKRNAKKRGITWNLTLAEWWSAWQESGHWNMRGRGKNKYAMARIADTDGYEIGNIEIITNSQNAKDYYEVHFDDWYEKAAAGHGWDD